MNDSGNYFASRLSGSEAPTTGPGEDREQSHPGAPGQGLGSEFAVSGAAIPSPPHDPSDDSVQRVVADVEAFTGTWIQRIRLLIHRSAQLVQREEMLRATAQQLEEEKAEWLRRTAATEENLRSQAKRLTEAWLEVEAERRTTMQNAQVAGAGATAAPNPLAGRGAAAPVGHVDPVPGTRPVSQEPSRAVGPANVAESPPRVSSAQPGLTPGSSSPQNPPDSARPVVASNPVLRGAAAGPSQMPAAPPKVNPVSKVPAPPAVNPDATAAASYLSTPNLSPANGGRPTSRAEPSAAGDPSQELDAAAESQRRIDEFRRMQRAVKGHQDKSN